MNPDHDCTVGTNGKKFYYIKGKRVNENVFKSQVKDWSDEDCLTIEQKRDLLVKVQKLSVECKGDQCKTSSTIINEYLADSKTMDTLCRERIDVAINETSKRHSEQLSALKDEINFLRKAKTVDDVKESVDRLTQELNVQKSEKSKLMSLLVEAKRELQESQKLREEDGERMKEEIAKLKKVEAKLFSDFIDEKDRCRNVAKQAETYQNFIEELKAQGVNKEKMDELLAINKQLEQMKTSLQKKADLLEENSVKLNTKLEQAEKKLMEVGDKCLFSEDSAQQCIKDIREKFPNVVAMLVNKEGKSAGVFTSGGSFVPIAPPMRLPSEVTQGAVPFNIETPKKTVKAAAIPIAPPLIPAAPSIPTAPSVQVKQVTAPMAPSTRDSLLSSIRSGATLKKTVVDKCKDNEYYSVDGKCLSYQDLRGFDEDDCDEDEGESFYWKTMSCSRDVDDAENKYYKGKYQKFVSKKAASIKEDAKEATMKGISSLKSLIEECEKQGLKYSIKEKRCVGTPVMKTPSKQEQKAAPIMNLTPEQKAILARRAAIAEDENEENDEWDE